MANQRRPARDASTGRDRQSHPRRTRIRPVAGQAIVEFAIASILFFLIVFGTIDFGRSIYIYAELTNAAREGARYASVCAGAPQPCTSSQIESYVVSKAPTLGLTASNITVTCTPSCQSGKTVTVSADLRFQAITQQFLSIKPVTMKASATDTIE